MSDTPINNSNEQDNVIEQDVKNTGSADSTPTTDANATADSTTKGRIIDIKAARVVAVQCVYSYQISGCRQSLKELALDIIDSWDSDKYFKFSNSQINQQYLFKVLNTVIKHFSQINQDIDALLDEKWEKDRIAKTVLAIIQVATAEIYRKELDTPIIINEYLNIAMQMGYDKEKGFINSILDKIGKKYS